MRNNPPLTCHPHCSANQPELQLRYLVRSGNKLLSRSSINLLHNSDHYLALTISILWVWNVKLGDFSVRKGSVLVRMRMETF